MTMREAIRAVRVAFEQAQEKIGWGDTDSGRIDNRIAAAEAEAEKQDAALREKDVAIAEAMALVLSHEGHIEKADAAYQRAREAWETAGTAIWEDARKILDAYFSREVE